MPLNLANHEAKAKAAVKRFWTGRGAARDKQTASGRLDQGERSAVNGGKNMDGFIDLASDLVRANGLKDAEIHLQRKTLTLPGFFRPTKIWDMLVLYRGQLVSALEFKSQVGPSFGNNFNNRAEEAIGSAADFWTAYRENAYGSIPRPFLGWLMLVEDAAGSRSPVGEQSPHFPVFPEFRGASYLDRYHLLCKKTHAGTILHRCHRVGIAPCSHENRPVLHSRRPHQPHPVRRRLCGPYRGGGGGQVNRRLA